jgi:hypothetical protein
MNGIIPNVEEKRHLSEDNKRVNIILQNTIRYNQDKKDKYKL